VVSGFFLLISKKVNVPAMPEEALNQPKKVSRSFAIGIGATEIMFLLGFLSLAAGIALLFGIKWALVVCGALLIAVSIYNDQSSIKGKN
jgi:hypothetical protein